MIGEGTSTIRSHGLAVDVRDGWEASVYRRAALPGERAEAVVHLATFPLPAKRGDFGAGAVELMGRDDIFVSLFEYGAGAAKQALFSHDGWPVIAAEQFATARLQHAIRGQSGVQHFFRLDARAFCLYVVLGSHARRAALAPLANDAVQGLRVEPIA